MEGFNFLISFEVSLPPGGGWEKNSLLENDFFLRLLFFGIW